MSSQVSAAVSEALQQLEMATAQFWSSVRNVESALGVESFEEAVEKGTIAFPAIPGLSLQSPSSPAQVLQALQQVTQNISTTIPVSVIPTRATKSQIFTAVKNQITSPIQFFPSSPTVNRIASFETPYSNAGNFYVGDSTVNKTQYGTPLAPGTDVDYTIDDLSKIYYLVDYAGDQIIVNWEWGYGKITP